MMIGAGVTASTADCHPCLHPLLLISSTQLLPDLAIRILSSCLSWILMMETPSCIAMSTAIPPQLFSYLQFSILKLRQFLNFLLFTYHMVNFFHRKMQKTYFHKPLYWFTSELWSGRPASLGVWRISCVRLHKDFMLILLRRLRTSNTPVHFLNSKLLVKNLWPKSFEKIPPN